MGLFCWRLASEHVLWLRDCPAVFFNITATISNNSIIIIMTITITIITTLKHLHNHCYYLFTITSSLLVGSVDMDLAYIRGHNSCCSIALSLHRTILGSMHVNTVAQADTSCRWNGCKLAIQTLIRLRLQLQWLRVPGSA